MLHWLSETLGTLYFALLILENWKGKKNEKNIPVWRECTEPCVAASLDWSQWSESTLPLIYPVCRRKVVFVPENRTKQILRLSVIIEPLRLVPGRYCHQFSKSWQMNLCHSLYFWPDCIFYYFITSICGDNYSNAIRLYLSTIVHLLWSSIERGKEAFSGKHHCPLWKFVTSCLTILRIKMKSICI